MLRFIYVYLGHSKSFLSWRLSSGLISAGVAVIICLLATRTANEDIMVNYQTAVCGISVRSLCREFLILMCLVLWQCEVTFLSKILSLVKNKNSCCNELICFVVLIKHFSLHFQIIETTESRKFSRPSFNISVWNHLSSLYYFETYNSNICFLSHFDFLILFLLQNWMFMWKFDYKYTCLLVTLKEWC